MIPDFHATVLHLLGLDHERLTFRHAGRDFRLTDVHGRVVCEIISRAGFASRSIPGFVDAVQMAVASQKESSIGNRRRCAKCSLKLAGCQLFEFATGLEYGRLAIPVAEVNPPADLDGRGVVISAEPLSPDFLAGQSINAGGDTTIIDDKYLLADEEW